jgi:RHS repeat-associated protein
MQIGMQEIENDSGRQCQQAKSGMRYAVSGERCVFPADLTFLLLFWSSKKVGEIRGFTGHEHYPYFKIINMNGRLYDPVIARFFSPDKYVQNPGFTQSFNRYTYARNCPLMFKDPTGYEDEYYYGELPGVEVLDIGPDFDPFDILQRTDDRMSDILLEVFNATHDPITNPNQVRRNFVAALLKSGMYQKPPTPKTPPNIIDSDEGVLLVPISDEYVNTIGLTSTTFGGSVVWAAAETAFGNAGIWTNSLKYMRVGGNLVSGVGTGATLYNVGVKWNNNTDNTADYVDLGASGILLAAGLMLAL